LTRRSAAAAPKEVSQFLKSTGQTYLGYSFVTFTLPYFSKLHSKWYRKENDRNIKVVPCNIADLLTPIALAYWLAGDGSYVKAKGIIQISTYSFTPQEVDQLRSVLLDQFNIESTRNVLRPGQYMIRIPKREVPQVQQLVKAHIPPTMASRVGLES
jgi:hypothetical protein